MSHQRQVGGTHKLYGTSIPNELGKLSWKLAAFVALFWALRTNRSLVSRYVFGAKALITSTIWGLAHQARSAITIAGK
jgi:hypothetical protein